MSPASSPINLPGPADSSAVELALGGLLVWAIVLTIFDGTSQTPAVHNAVWLVFGGWCIGVIGSSIAHFMYRR